MIISEKLKYKIYSIINYFKEEKFGIAFSGGVDSSLLAKACKDLNKEFSLLTIGLFNSKDILTINQSSNFLNVSLKKEIIQIEKLEKNLIKILSIKRFSRIASLENYLCFYYVFKLASKYKISTVISANGLDELFCGYNIFKILFGNLGELKNHINKLVEIAQEDSNEIAKIASLFQINFSCPFLSSSFINFANKIPIKFKIEGKDDILRKLIIRKVAYDIGVPKYIAYKPKKAFQYSSGIHKAIRTLAKRKGFKKNISKKLGYKGEIDAYIAHLINENNL